MEIVSRKDAEARGLVRYFTGKPCKHGHIAERTTCDCACVECGRIESANNRESRKEYMRLHMRKWRAENGDKARETVRKSYRKHSEQRRADARDYRAKDPDKFRASLRASYAKYRLERSIAMKAYRQENREALNAMKRNYKARKRDAEGSHTVDDVMALFEQQRGICNGCGISIADGYHVDHIHPLSRGGSNWPANLQILCSTCNTSKSNRTMEEWRARSA